MRRSQSDSAAENFAGAGGDDGREKWKNIVLMYAFCAVLAAVDGDL